MHHKIYKHDIFPLYKDVNRIECLANIENCILDFTAAAARGKIKMNIWQYKYIYGYSF